MLNESIDAIISRVMAGECAVSGHDDVMVVEEAYVAVEDELRDPMIVACRSCRVMWAAGRITAEHAETLNKAPVEPNKERQPTLVDDMMLLTFLVFDPHTCMTISVPRLSMEDPAGPLFELGQIVGLMHERERSWQEGHTATDEKIKLL